MNEIDTKKSEMYMANAQILRWDPSNLYSTGLHLGFASGKTQLLGFASGKICVTLREPKRKSVEYRLR